MSFSTTPPSAERLAVDALTALPNRYLFRHRLQEAVERAARRGDYRFALLVIDLDRFKTINSSLGHPVGDRLLVEVAARLLDCVGPSDFVARISGDEFAILVNHIGGLIDARQMAERVNRALARPMLLEERQIFTTAGIGITISNPRYRNADECLRDADTALYRAKAAGGGRQIVFAPGMHHQAMEVLHLEHALRRALSEGELELAYQPLVDLESGRLAEFEALVRWRHPDRGLLLPDAFLPLAEDTGILADLDEWVLATACAQLRRWQDEFPQKVLPAVAINVSSRQISRPEWVAQVQESLRRHRLEARHLRLEITEGALIETPEEAVDMLTHLRALGIHVALDDFGTGYSSLAYLHRFPVDTLKIDRSFLGGEGRCTPILETIVLLAQKLGLRTVAEGIETAEDLAIVQALGCDLGQGFLLARPLEAKQAAQCITDPNFPERALPAKTRHQKFS